MKDRIPREKLSAAEAEKTRELMRAHGANGAAQKLGIHVETLRKVALGEGVHRLTAATVRSRLAGTI